MENKTVQDPSFYIRNSDANTLLCLVFFGVCVMCCSFFYVLIPSCSGYSPTHTAEEGRTGMKKGMEVRMQAEDLNPSTPYVNHYLVDINSGSVADFLLLPGIGETLAKKIIEERETHGRFQSVEDLARVYGIGQKKIDALRKYIAPVKSGLKPAAEKELEKSSAQMQMP